MKNVDVSNTNTKSNYSAATRLWQQFREQFPTPEHHLRELYRRMGDRVKCEFCSSKSWHRNEGRTFIKCLNCRKKSYPLRGSLFHRARNLEARRFAIHLKEQRAIISKAAFGRLVGVSNDCSWNIHTAVDAVIDDSFGEDPMSAPSWEFEEVIAKRSRETPARLHPFSEQELAEKELAPYPSDESQNQAILDEFPSIQRRVFDEIKDTPISFDVLLDRLQLDVASLTVALVMLELAFVITRLPGNLFKRTKHRRN